MMKRIILLSLLICSFTWAGAQEHPYKKDVESIDAIIKALYESICGEADEARDWERFKYLFTNDAKLIPTGKAQDGEVNYKYWTPSEYVEMFTSSRRTVGFYEKELHRITEQHGTIAQVFSTYATMEIKDGPITRRGINSIQLLKGKDRWYIMSIFWSNETAEFPLPEKYLEKDSKDR